MAATAADIPIELYDLILSFFVCESTWISCQPKNCNYVPASKRELGSVALVCRQWAPLCQPNIFHEVTLRKWDDVESLLALLANPKCRIADYIQSLILSHSVAAYPDFPWIHTVVIQLIPKLRRKFTVDRMTLTGPLPAGRSLTSIHGVLPRRYPFFATGIELLALNDLHLKSFGHLVQLLRELPSLINVHCEKVTWDSLPDTPLPVTTSYLDRDTTRGVRYHMEECTNNAAAGWLGWLLTLTLPSRVEQQDSDALCRIASDLVKNVDAARFPDWNVQSWCCDEFIHFWAWTRGSGPRLTPTVILTLTSAVPGERTRRVQGIILDFTYVGDVSSFVGWDCWQAIDEQLAMLPSLNTVHILTWSHDDLVLLATDVVTPKMPSLLGSDKLKYAHGTGPEPKLWFTHDMINSNRNLDESRQIERLDDTS